MNAPAPAAAPLSQSSSESASVYQEAATFVAVGGLIILVAHSVEVVVAGVPNWPALAIRVAWCAVLLAVAAMFRTGTRSKAAKGAAIGIFASAVLDLVLLWVTGRSHSPLLSFTPVLATVLPFVAFDAIAVGLAGGALLLAGTGGILLADRAPLTSYIALLNAGVGALACGWLLARAFERARRAEVRRLEQLSEAMASIRTLKGLLPLCAWCRRVRTDTGYWEQIESYIAGHSEATFTHGVCQECQRKHFPDTADAPDPL